MVRAFPDTRHSATARLRPWGRCGVVIAAGLCLTLFGCAAPAGGGSSFSGPYGGITGGTGDADGR